LFLPIIAYTLSTTKLEISEGRGRGQGGRGGGGAGEGGRNDPNIVCTYKKKKQKAM
jgi:hypothetical protein